MLRRLFLKKSAALALGGLLAADGSRAQSRSAAPDRGVPVTIRMGGYGPPSTSFSRGLEHIGSRLAADLGGAVDVRYVYNVMDAGYGGTDLSWLVESGVLTLAYATLSENIPELEAAALPFVFADVAAARAAMDGPLGAAAARSIEDRLDVRVLGFFENGFRHISNNVRPVRTLTDLQGLSIRVLPVQVRTFELLGAEPHAVPLTDAIPAIASGELDGQENPFANTVTYGLHERQRYHTATYHSYLSRAVFVNRQSFESWSAQMQTALRRAVREAVVLQRGLKDREEVTAAETIRTAGGEIVELTPSERQRFVDAVAAIYAEAEVRYAPELLALLNL